MSTKFEELNAHKISIEHFTMNPQKAKSPQEKGSGLFDKLLSKLNGSLEKKDPSFEEDVSFLKDRQYAIVSYADKKELYFYNDWYDVYFKVNSSETLELFDKRKDWFDSEKMEYGLADFMFPGEENATKLAQQRTNICDELLNNEDFMEQLSIKDGRFYDYLKDMVYMSENQRIRWAVAKTLFPDASLFKRDLKELSLLVYQAYGRASVDSAPISDIRHRMPELIGMQSVKMYDELISYIKTKNNGVIFNVNNKDGVYGPFNMPELSNLRFLKDSNLEDRNNNGEQFPVWNDLYQDVLPEIQAIKEQNAEKLLKFLDEIANAGFDPETERQKVDELISTDNMLMELLSDEVKKHIKTIIRELDSQQSFNQRDLKTEIQPSQIDLDEGPTMEQ